MDMGSAGYGAGGGILGAILAWAGIKQRLDGHEKRIETLESDTVWKDQHAECSRSWHDALARLDSKLDIVLAKLGDK